MVITGRDASDEELRKMAALPLPPEPRPAKKKRRDSADIGLGELRCPGCNHVGGFVMSVFGPRWVCECKETPRPKMESRRAPAGKAGLPCPGGHCPECPGWRPNPKWQPRVRAAPVAVEYESEPDVATVKPAKKRKALRGGVGE